MDTWEATTVVFERVHALDPDHATKIVGLLLVHDDDDKALTRLAFGPDHLLHSFVAKARAELAAMPSSPMLAPPSPRADQVGCDASSPHPDDYDDCWSPVNGGLRRSLSLSDAAWKPCCKYFARGFCEDGSSCRFPHTLPEQDSVAVMRRAKSMAARPPPRLTDPAFSLSPSPKGLNEFMFPQQQSDAQRSAAAAMLQLGGGEDLSRFSVMRSPRMMGLMHSPAALQIYMTFPAESTFTEEDVSNYFSKYGPVQDVRIPYQQRRMFGFVTFVYPETVRTVLSMRNPHLVCAARVLVKPYKEKGKVLHRKLSRPHHGEFTTPTGLLDPRDRFDDLQQPQIGPRNIASQEAVLRRKLLEEQQQAAELQQAIDLQSRRFMGLQLLDLNSRDHRLGNPVTSPMSPGQTDGKGSVNGDGNAVHLEDVTADNKLNSSSIAMCAPAFSAVSETAAEGKGEEQQKQEDGDGTTKNAVNHGAGEERRESGLVTAAPIVACAFEESGVDHNLPASLLDDDCAGATAQNDSMSPYHVASSLFPPRSSHEVAPNNSCFFQVPRFTSGHEAIEL